MNPISPMMLKASDFKVSVMLGTWIRVTVPMAKNAVTPTNSIFSD